MPEQLTFDPVNGLINIRAWGAEEISDWLASRQEILRLYHKHGACMLFVDARELVSVPSVVDIFDFGDEFPRQIRTAILISKDTPDDVLFLDSVATHRKKPMRVFYSKDEALNWLTKAI